MQLTLGYNEQMILQNNLKENLSEGIDGHVSLVSKEEPSDDIKEHQP